jgi:hypothetical protein
MLPSLCVGGASVARHGVRVLGLVVRHDFTHRAPSVGKEFLYRFAWNLCLTILDIVVSETTQNADVLWVLGLSCAWECTSGFLLFDRFLSFLLFADGRNSTSLA